MERWLPIEKKLQFLKKVYCQGQRKDLQLYLQQQIARYVFNLGKIGLKSDTFTWLVTSTQLTLKPDNVLAGSEWSLASLAHMKKMELNIDDSIQIYNSLPSSIQVYKVYYDPIVYLVNSQNQWQVNPISNYLQPPMKKLLAKPKKKARNREFGETTSIRGRCITKRM